MKQQEKTDKDIEKEGERKRFNAWLTENFGPKPDLRAIAERVGLGYQALYFITTERNYVSANFHRQFAKTFPGYDLNWVMFGIEREDGSAPVTADDKALFRLQAENVRLHVEIDFLKQQRDEANQEKAKYWKLLENLHEQKLDFRVVSSHVTDLFFPGKETKFVTPQFSDFSVNGPKRPIGASWNLPGVTNLGDAVSE